MFASKIVFILGAGAGHEIGMPLGSALTRIIAQKMTLTRDTIQGRHLHGDVALFEDVSRGREGQKWFIAAKRLSEGLLLSKSIDDFLNLHQHDEEVVRLGKSAIIKSILEAEEKSKLFSKSIGGEPVINFENVADGWMIKFMHMLGQGNINNIFDNVAFINFNYDRCLEHFLLHAVRGLHGVNFAAAAAVMRKIEIFHPYGYIGDLPQMGGVVGFGDSLQDAHSISDRILTYSEKVEEGESLSNMREQIRDARAIVFLGFGFHKQNMDLIRLQPGYSAKKVYATALGISDADRHVVESRISGLFDPVQQVYMLNNIHVNTDVDCRGLMQQYMLTLPELT
jgi:hypothetical protein